MLSRPPETPAPTPTSASAVVILGFAHRQSSALSLRFETGLETYFSRMALHEECWLVMTGGDTNMSGQTEAQYLADKAVARGVPRSRVVLEDLARYTIENALFVFRILDSLSTSSSSVQTIYLVTNDFHMLRSSLIFKGVLIQQGFLQRRRTFPFRVIDCIAPNSETLYADTGRSLKDWLEGENYQMENLRSENGSNVGNVLSQRIKDHEHLPMAAKNGNLGALDSWNELYNNNNNNNNATSPQSDDGKAPANGLGVNSQFGRGGAKPLHYAVLYSQPDAVDWILGHGGDPNAKNVNGATPLHLVSVLPVGEKKTRIRLALVGAGAREEEIGRSSLWEGGRTAGGASTEGLPPPPPLSKARLCLFGSLLAFGDLVYTPLVAASREGDVEAVQAWLDAADRCPATGKVLNIDGPEDYVGTTALAHAASGGSAQVVAMLLAAGADVRLPLEPRANPLHYATFKMHRQCFEMLVKSKHAKDALASRGNSALWASLGAVTVKELGIYNSVQIKEFCLRLEGLEAEADLKRRTGSVGKK